ncbi:MAG TPA: class I SAM-dependent methyltransferase [Solirubrobacterales bacterium]
MTPAQSGPRRDREAARLERIYRRYAGSARKRQSWSATNRGNVAIRQELLGAVLELAEEPLKRGGEILDVGCGSGRLLAEFAARGVEQGHLHGVDLIESRLAAARMRVPDAEIRFADARSLPFEDGRFELVTLLTTLSSMQGEDSIGEALGEVSRVVSATGIVLCYEPRISNPLNQETVTVSSRALSTALGPAVDSRTLTGFPPLARRLGPLTSRLYPILARLAPTHRITVHESGGARRPRG